MNDAAALAGVHVNTLRRKIRASELEAERDGNGPTAAYTVTRGALEQAGYTLTNPTTDRLAELERENSELRRRVEVAEALAAEREHHLSDLRLAIRALEGRPSPKSR